MCPKKYLFFSLLACFFAWGLALPAMAKKKPNGMSFVKPEMCLTDASSYFSFAPTEGIIFKEGLKTDLSAAQANASFDLVLPAGFELDPTVSNISVSFPSGSKIKLATTSPIVINPAKNKITITLEFVSGHDNEINDIKISGLKIKVTSTDPLKDQKILFKIAGLTSPISGITDGIDVASLNAAIPPKVVNGNTFNLCVGHPTNVPVALINAPISGTDYDWSKSSTNFGAPNFLITSPNPDLGDLKIFDTSVQGAYDVYVRTYFTGTCMSTEATKVTINIIAKPIITVYPAPTGTPVKICQGTNMSLVVFAANATNIKLTAGKGTAGAFVAEPITPDTECTISGDLGSCGVGNKLSVGSYTLRVTADKGGGCTSILDYPFDVTAAPTVTFAPPTTASFDFLTTDNGLKDLTTLLVPSPSGGTFSGPGVIGNSFIPSQSGGAGTKDIIYSYTDPTVPHCIGTVKQVFSVKKPSSYFDAYYCQPTTPLVFDGGTLPNSSYEIKIPSGDLDAACGPITSVKLQSTIGGGTGVGIDLGGGGILPAVAWSPTDPPANGIYVYDDGATKRFYFNPSDINLGVANVKQMSYIVTRGTCTFPITTKVYKSPAIPLYDNNNKDAAGKFVSCQGKVETYSVPVAANNTYTWEIVPSDMGTATINPNTPNVVNVTWAKTGTATLKLTQKVTYNVDESCPTVREELITIKATPTTAQVFSDAPTTVCAKETGYEVYYVPVEDNSDTYTWNISANGEPVSQGVDLVSASKKAYVNIKWKGTGTGTVTATISRGTCSKTTAPFSVTIKALPTPDILLAPACVGQADVVYAVKTPTIGSNYVWALTPASAGVMAEVVPGDNKQRKITWASVVPTGPITLTLTETTNPDGCTNSISKEIRLSPLPVADMEAPAQVCREVQFTLSTSQDANASNGYNWNFYSLAPQSNGNPNGSPVSGISKQPTSDPNKTNVTVGASVSLSVFWVRLEKTNDAGCNTVVWKSINVNDAPTVIVGGNDNVCIQTTTMYSDIVPGIPTDYDYEWTVDPSKGTIIGSAKEKTVNITWIKEGAHKVRLTKKVGATSCQDSDDIDVQVNPLPIATMTGSDVVCAERVENYSSTTGSGLMYVWTITGVDNYFVDPNDPNAKPTTMTTLNVNAYWKNNGTIAVTVKKDYNGGSVPPTVTCESVLTKNVTVYPLPSSSIIGDAIVCGQQDAKYPVAYTYTIPEIVDYEYIWIQPTQATSLTKPAPNKAVIVWASNEGAAPITDVLRVTLKRKVAPLCERTIELPIVINPTPKDDIVISHQCFGENTNFMVTAPQGNWLLEWTFDDKTTLEGPSVEKIFQQTGKQTVALKITNKDTRCAYHITEDFIIYPIPNPNFSHIGSCFGAPTTFMDNSTIATVTGAGGILKWQWDFGDPSTAASTTNPNFIEKLDKSNVQHTYSSTGSFRVVLTAVSADGCSESFEKDVFIFPQENPVTLTPYNFSFSAGKGGWIASGTNSSWTHGIPASSRTIKSTESIWGTGLTSDYKASQVSYLESPCFNLENLERPHIAIKMWMEANKENDGAALQVTYSDGKYWSTLGGIDEGLNWYDMANIVAFPESNKDVDYANKKGWSRQDGGWKTVRYPLDDVKRFAKDTLLAGKGTGSVRFRIVFASNADNPFNLTGTWDGVGVAGVFVGSRNRIVLMENFTRANDNATIIANQAMIKTFPGTFDEILKMQYATNFTIDSNDKNVDKLYKDNPAEPGARALYYGVNTVPNAIIDGVSKPSKEKDVLEKSYKREVLIPSIFKIDVDFPATSTTGELKIRVKVKALEAVSDPMLIHTVVLEKAITGANAGVPSVPQYEFVMKKMLPSAAGLLDTKAWAANEERTYEQTISLYQASTVFTNGMLTKIYDPTQVQVVAFLQSDKDKSVYQSASASPTIAPTLATANEPTLKLPDMRIYPNPANEQVTLDFGEALRENCTWELLNTLGVTAAKGRLVAGTEETKIQTDKLPRGMYLLKITEEKSKNAVTYKLVLR